MNWCHECERVQLHGGKRPWHAYARSSPELLRLCVQSLVDLGKDSMRLIEAEFARDEDDEEAGELQLQLRLGLQVGDFSIEVDRRAVVLVEDVVCTECEPKTRGWSWRAFVQLRFKVPVLFAQS